MGTLFSREQNEPQKKKYSSIDTSVTFADTDDHDFECKGYGSRAMQMSCGHSVTPQSLTDWCERQLKEGKTEFVCGNCDAVWPFEEVCKMVPDNKKTFELKRFINSFNDLQADYCPGCMSYVSRMDPKNLCVHCPKCTARNGKGYEYCWQCHREWKGPAPRSDKCDNEGCENPDMKALKTLRTCPEIKFKSVTNVTGCPSIRACPICGELVGHNSENCKNVACPGCGVGFCFVCLKLTKDCSGKIDAYFSACSDGVAPRQTSIPVKRKI